MKKQLIALIVIAAAVSSHASLVWTGAGDGISLFLEANFLDDNGVVPAANTINANAEVAAATGGLIEINSGTGGPAAFGGTFMTGLGNALAIGGAKTLGSTSTSGMRQTAGFNDPLVAANLSGASTVNVQFAVNYAFVLDGGSTLRFRGSGNALNNSTANFLDAASVLQFDAESYTTFTNEHASKVTTLGWALNFGTDPYTVDGAAGENAIATDINGGAGVQIQAIPEPATLGLVALFGGGIVFLRRRLTF